MADIRIARASKREKGKDIPYAEVRRRLCRRVPLATLTIHGAPDLTNENSRKRLYNWLCQQATDFTWDWHQYARRYTARLER